MKWMLSFFLLFSHLASAQEYEQFIQIHQSRAQYLFTQRSQIAGVEIIVADRASNMASRFGHALLRFVDRDGYWANDIVISFGAISETEKLSLIKGVFGGYSILPEVMTLHEYWGRYTKNENRDLRRYVLNLNPKQLDAFLDVTFKYVKNPEELKNYTFTRNNCVGVISKFLIEADLTIDDKQAIVPTRVHKWLQKNNLTLYPELIMKNPSLLEEKIAQESIEQMSSQDLIKKFSPQELAYIYINKEINFSQVQGISSHLNNLQFDMDDAFGVTNIAPQLYTRCSSLECFRIFNVNEKNLKISEQLDIISYRLQQNTDESRLYLAHREFQKWDLINIKDLRIIDNKFKLTQKKNKIYFVASTHDQKVSTALQFTVKGNQVFLLDEEIGSLIEGKLILKKNMRFVLYGENENQIFSLIKI